MPLTAQTFETLLPHIAPRSKKVLGCQVSDVELLHRPYPDRSDYEVTVKATFQYLGQRVVCRKNFIVSDDVAMAAATQEELARALTGAVEGTLESMVFEYLEPQHARATGRAEPPKEAPCPRCSTALGAQSRALALEHGRQYACLVCGTQRYVTDAMAGAYRLALLSEVPEGMHREQVLLQAVHDATVVGSFARVRLRAALRQWVR